MSQQPSAEQWRALRQVLERVTAARGYMLPAIEIRWTGDDELPEDVNARAHVSDDGTVIVLRVSQSPAELRRTFSHELSHALDGNLIRSGRLAYHVVEHRAREFSSQFGY
jgi:hypothetical protein